MRATRPCRARRPTDRQQRSDGHRSTLDSSPCKDSGSRAASHSPLSAAAALSLCRKCAVECQSVQGDQRTIQRGTHRAVSRQIHLRSKFTQIRDGGIQLQPHLSSRDAHLAVRLLCCALCAGPFAENPPHVFGLAEDTYRALCTEGEDQCVIISVRTNEQRNQHTALDDRAQQLLAILCSAVLLDPSLRPSLLFTFCRASPALGKQRRRRRSCSTSPR